MFNEHCDDMELYDSFYIFLMNDTEKKMLEPNKLC